jgi:integrase
MRGVKRLRQPLTPAELEKLKPRLAEPLADLVAVLLAAGLRLGEATHLRADDVDIAGANVVIRSRPDYLVKDREEREVPVDDVEARSVLARRRLGAGPSTRPSGSLGGAGGLLFANSRGRVPDGRDLLRELHRAAREAGIRRVDFYLLRHTYATEMARRVMPYELAARMGHSDVRTANKFYVHLGRRADAS